MDACLCSAVHRLAEHYDEDCALSLVPAIGCFLQDLRALLAQSKALSRNVPFRITTTTNRTGKALSVDAVDLEPVDQVCDAFRQDVDGFWAAPASASSAHAELRRRLACVVVFLRWKLDAQAAVPAAVARLLPEHVDLADIRNSGRKYVKIARKIGGAGAVFWLPLDVPASTYERYLNMDDERVFAHLASLQPQFAQYTDLVQRLILPHLGGGPSSDLSGLSHYNLAVDYGDWIPPSSLALLLLHALGGSDVPDIVLKSVRIPQRRWNDEGEIESTGAVEAGIPPELVHLLSDEAAFSRIMADLDATQSVLDGGHVAWSLPPATASLLSGALLPRVAAALGETALKLACFACPPCYEGNTEWSPSIKNAVWPVLERAATTHKMQLPLRVRALEAVCFFCERDSVALRRRALELAQTLLHKSMAYYLHASVVLFASVLLRVDGELARSAAQIGQFTSQGPAPATRRDRALRGRLHISQIENKIKSYDADVASTLYQWTAFQSTPLSTLDSEVTFRLQSTAARFFQSVADWPAARASLEQILALDSPARPMRASTRRILVGRLADICCDMQACDRARELLAPELHLVRIATADAAAATADGRFRRGFRRLLLASAEAHIGLGQLDAAAAVLVELEPQECLAEPLGVPPLHDLHDLHDQQLHMRRLVAAARIAHMQPQSWASAAQARWTAALGEVARMHTLKSASGFTAAVIHLSLAHAQLGAGDVDGARRSWAAGTAILQRETCEFWLPTVSTVWLPRIAAEVCKAQGWSFRMMLPGGKPDIVWP